MATKEKSPELLLPNDQTIRASCNKRLEEKREEIKRYNQEHPAQHPEFQERILAQQICEVRILEQLLKSGKVVGWDLSKQIMEERQKKDQGSMERFYYGWGYAWETIAALT